MRDNTKKAIGLDAYNQLLTEECTMSLTARATDAHHIPCVIIPLDHHPNDSRLKLKEDNASQTLNSRMGTGGIMFP